MRDYELVVILNPEISEENVPNSIEKLTGFVTGKGGTVVEVNRWGKRKLAYPINRFREGNYVLARLQLEPKLTTDLEANLKLSADVIRHLLVRL